MLPAGLLMVSQNTARVSLSISAASDSGRLASAMRASIPYSASPWAKRVYVAP